uniref:B30.2/SPRY domain-containing protein n=1 Tax=Sinocyclocheilus rhinocerous TaxID=307959 RepID=A0A673GFW6_9TELE
MSAAFKSPLPIHCHLALVRLLQFENKSARLLLTLQPFTDPVHLPCGHNFCQTCIQVVWNMDDPKTSREWMFCPECQILLPPDLELEINSDLQRKVQDAFARAPLLEESSQMSPSIIMCDQCIGKTEVAVKSCITCDASLELKLFCQEDQIAVCCLCIAVVEKYSQIKAHIEEDQKLMLAILETEEIYTNKWLRWRRSESLKCHVKDINAALRSSQTLLEEENDVKFLQVHISLFFSAHIPFLSVFYLTIILPYNVTYHFFPPAGLRAIRLDPETAHPELEVSADRLEVHWSKKLTPERKQKTNISSQYSVRAKERFSSGSHYWEVAVWKKPFWLIGLSYGSATGDQDSEHCNGDFNNAFCYIYHGNGKYLICQDSNEKPLAVRETIQKLGVRVDIQKGNVSFYDGDTLALLHSFYVEFSGPVYPIFNPCIDINGQNNQPLSTLSSDGPPASAL